MSKNIEYKWSTDQTKLKGDSRMKYVYTRTGDKKPAGEIVAQLIQQHQADHLKATYEESLGKVLALYENEALAQAYGRSPMEMI